LQSDTRAPPPGIDTADLLDTLDVFRQIERAK
jgi:hypothetical protein